MTNLYIKKDIDLSTAVYTNIRALRRVPLGNVEDFKNMENFKRY